MLFSRQRGKGDATSHYAARWLRLAAAVGSVKWPSSRRPSPTTNVTITNHFVNYTESLQSLSSRFNDRAAVDMISTAE